MESNYEQRAKALRYCVNARNCEKCTYRTSNNSFKCRVQHAEDAAAAIEALLKQNKELIEDRPEMVETDGHWEWRKPNGEVIMPKRGKWVVREVDIPGELHPVAFRCMCSMCRNEYVFPRIPQYCPDCGSMNKEKMEVQDG